MHTSTGRECGEELPHDKYCIGCWMNEHSEKKYEWNNKEIHRVIESIRTHGNFHYFLSKETGIPCDLEILALRAG